MVEQVYGQGLGQRPGLAAWGGRDEPLLIADETDWREPTARPERTDTQILMGRWRAYAGERHEATARTDDDCHVIGIALRRMDLRFEVAGRTMMDGLVMPGMTNITEPGTSSACLFRSPYDALHLRIPNTLIAECGQDGPLVGFGIGSVTLPARVSAKPDPIVHNLATALLGAERLGAGFAPAYADSIGLAIVTRLLATAAGTDGADRPRVAALPKWRLKRAVDYIEANLSEPLCLADMAASTGLTRMHFAAQFRAATGLPPHEYLLRRRIERAQEMLARSPTPVVEVALQVGFQTQAHFTSVFKRFSGAPPHAWRQLQRQAA